MHRLLCVSPRPRIYRWARLPRKEEETWDPYAFSAWSWAVLLRWGQTFTGLKLISAGSMRWYHGSPAVRRRLLKTRLLGDDHYLEQVRGTRPWLSGNLNEKNPRCKFFILEFGWLCLAFQVTWTHCLRTQISTYWDQSGAAGKRPSTLESLLGRQPQRCDSPLAQQPWWGRRSSAFSLNPFPWPGSWFPKN